MGKSTVTSVAKEAKPVLVAYGVFYHYSDNTAQPANFSTGTLFLHLPKSFSMAGKKVKIFCLSDVVYMLNIGSGSQYMDSHALICMLNRPFDREVSPGESVSMNGKFGTSTRLYIQFQFPTKFEANETDMPTYGQILMKRLYAYVNVKAWSNNGDGGRSPHFCVPFRYEFYE